jgi:hypothetical protein
MCDYIGNEFGASYPDSVCIDGYLWDADSGYPSDGGWVYTFGGDIPCPQCNPVDLITAHYQENQAIIDEDCIECKTCGGIIFDDHYSAFWLPTCPYCGF